MEIKIDFIEKEKLMNLNEKKNLFYLDKPRYKVPQFEKMEDGLVKLNKKIREDIKSLINRRTN